MVLKCFQIHLIISFRSLKGICLSDISIYVKIQKCDTIDNETTIHQRLNDKDMENSSLPSSLKTISETNAV